MEDHLLTNPELARKFPDLHPPLERQAAMVEANRCLNCFDAPCTAACPTHIDVPRFIKKIATENVRGSALTILDANILGASCARVCPVAVLCEGACVMHSLNMKPIEIGRLQRFAMDEFFINGAHLPSSTPPEKNFRIACIGAGPASLSCSAELRKQGYRVSIFERRSIPGGLNTFGVAEYKLRAAESLKEVEMIKALGVDLRLGEAIANKADLRKLENEFDAVFIGVGLGAMRRLEIPGEDNAAVVDAVTFIERYKIHKTKLVKGEVIVVGAGNTAVDAAIAAVRLGATHVTILSRRTEQHMSAFSFEFEHAKQEGVSFQWLTQPVAISQTEGGATLLHCQTTSLTSDGKAVPVPNNDLVLPFDLLLSAIGQSPLLELLSEIEQIELDHGRLAIDRETGRTSNPKFYAGGDCVNGGREVVDAVADGKRAAKAIARALEVSA